MHGTVLYSAREGHAHANWDIGHYLSFHGHMENTFEGKKVVYFITCCLYLDDFILFIGFYISSGFSFIFDIQNTMLHHQN